MLELKLSQVTVIQKITSTNSHPTMHVKITAMDLVFNAGIGWMRTLASGSLFVPFYLLFMKELFD